MYLHRCLRPSGSRPVDRGPSYAYPDYCLIGSLSERLTGPFTPAQAEQIFIRPRKAEKPKGEYIVVM